ncbi:uncharacterized protein LOC131893112 [Tigriopus californicus]|uniref:uncharacterized protein LOC131893112 n=1 Tax=Tigriopus californicus TaxID=6832 RepID=UPI0027DA5083|nr:uncharacterized protein LOC131893112 [Tigriopus californicus]
MNPSLASITSMDERTPTVEHRPFGAHNTQEPGLAHLMNDLVIAHSSSDSSPDQEDSGAFPIPARAPAAGGSCSDMSASYHEIFDTQMPPETALTSLEREEQQLFVPRLPVDRLEHDPSDPGQNQTSHGAPEADLAIVLPRDDTANATTQYLTSKLVQDSLQWQQDHKDQPNLSPMESPRRRLRPLSHANDEDGRRDGRPSTIDPLLLASLENDARLLATSVDGLVENLSGILQSISALTVETIETYRDGVCKTCDEVDNNIKSMYQVMAKVEELNKSMAPAYKLGEQLKEIKRLLDMYEAVANVKP